MNNLALLLHEGSRYSDAEPLFKEALAIQEEAFGKRHPETASTRYNYAQLLADEGQLDAARVTWDEVLATDRALYPSGHPNIAYTLSAYGRLLLRLGEYKEAERLQREALEIRRKYHGESHPDVAYSLGALGMAVYERGRYDEAESLLRESLAMHRKLHPDHPISGAVMNDIGLVLYDRGEYAKAERWHREALEFQRSVAGDDERNAMAVSMVRRANDLAALGSLERADTLAREGYELVRRVHEDRGMWVVAAMIDLAAIRLQRGFVAEAESLFAAGLSRMRAFESGAPQRPRDTRALLGLGRCRMAARDFNAAEKYFREALDIERRYFGDEHPRTARAQTALASALIARGDLREAEPLLRSAESALSTMVLPAQIDRTEAKSLLAQFR
jgi:tetratricopeptide (TPR) repeat protein